MGIRFNCPNGHKLNVKEFQAGKKGFCPYCGVKFAIPTQSTRKSSKEARAALRALAASASSGNGNSQIISSGLKANLAATENQASVHDSAALPPNIEAALSAAGISAPQIINSVDLNLPNLPGSAGSSSAISQLSSLQNVPAGLKQAIEADPLVEAGDVVWYVRPPSGGQYGPATSLIMRQWLAEGRLSPDTLVWHEGWRDWQKAATIFQELLALEPMAKNSSDTSRLIQPGSSIVQLSSSRRNSNKKQLILIIVVILIVILLVSLIFWAVNRGSNAVAETTGTPSTLLVLRDTLILHCLL